MPEPTPSRSGRDPHQSPRSTAALLTDPMFGRHRSLLWLLAGIGAVGFAADPINTLAPPLAAALGGGDGLVAFLASAFGVGAATVALGTGRVQRRYGILNVAQVGSPLLAGGLVAAAAAPGPLVALAAFGVMGGGFLLGVSTFSSALQRRVNEDLRGRVMALWTVAFLGTRPLAALIDGGMADLFGVRVAFAIPVAVVVGGALVAMRLKRFGSPPHGGQLPPAR